MIELANLPFKAYAFETFAGLSNVSSFITTRFGPGGKDFSMGRNDHSNRNILSRALGISPENLVFLKQEHRDRVQVIEHPSASELVGDASVTNLPGTALAGLSADCPIVILYDPVREAAGTAHSSWRSTVSRIAPKTLEKMKKAYRTDPTDVIACVGSCICRRCFEIGPEVAEKLSGCAASAEDFMEPGRGDRSTADLAGIIGRQLVEAGVSPENLETSEVCTVCGDGEFYSYRGEGEGCGHFSVSVLLAHSPSVRRQEP